MLVKKGVLWLRFPRLMMSLCCLVVMYFCVCINRLEATFVFRGGASFTNISGLKTFYIPSYLSFIACNHILILYHVTDL